MAGEVNTMVIINDVRYQRHDAERLGLLKDETTPETPKKQRAPAKNKARTPEETK